MSHNIITKDYQGHSMQFRASDGWFNATKAAKVYGKTMYRFWLMSNMKPLQADDKQTDASPKGTWLHPKLAIVFAQWLDKKFGLWMFEQCAQSHDNEQLEGETYLSLNAFKEFAGYVLDQPSGSRLTNQAKLFTVEAGVEVKKMIDVRSTSHGTAYTAKVNHYPLRFWREACALLFPETK